VCALVREEPEVLDPVVVADVVIVVDDLRRGKRTPDAFSHHETMLVDVSRTACRHRMVLANMNDDVAVRF